MEESIAAGFQYSNTTRELWNSIDAAYAQKRNKTQIFY